jgi:hypothetical protein
VFNTLPAGVVNSGIAEPDIVIENVLSRMLDKLSVTLIVKVVVVSTVTNAGVPLITPLLVIFVPGGNVPLSNVYVIVVAGDTGDADNCVAINIVAGYVPIEPAVVFQIGCAILMCAQML